MAIQWTKYSTRLEWETSEARSNPCWPCFWVKSSFCVFYFLFYQSHCEKKKNNCSLFFISFIEKKSFFLNMIFTWIKYMCVWFVVLLFKKKKALLFFAAFLSIEQYLLGRRAQSTATTKSAGKLCYLNFQNSTHATLPV